jgi:hypothetical protein
MDEVAMGPLAQPLVLMAALVGPIGYVTHIANRNVGHRVLLAEAHDLATGFMQEVAGLARKARGRLGLAPGEAAPPLTALLAGLHAPVIRGVALVPQALD